MKRIIMLSLVLALLAAIMISSGGLAAEPATAASCVRVPPIRPAARATDRATAVAPDQAAPVRSFTARTCRAAASASDP